MKNVIEHQGVVASIDDSHVKVRIVQAAACSACKAKELCSSSESKEKYIDVYDVQPGKYAIGETVRVCGTLTMGKMAVRLAFGIPLLIMCLWVGIASYVLNLSDGWVLLGMALLLTAYFCVLHRLSPRLSKKFAFWIE